jgi:hypothetical protein
MKTFTVKVGAPAIVIKDGKQPGDEATITEFVTRKESVFAESEVEIDPEGRFGRRNQKSRTIGGDYARMGMMGFSKPGLGMVLIVHARDISESTGEDGLPSVG